MNPQPKDAIHWEPSHMVEVYLREPDDFLKIKETLGRIGISSKRDNNTLYQSCHILHKQGRYFIVHFKELFLLDGKPSTFTYDDLCRRNTITTLLSDWGLCTLADQSVLTDVCSLKSIKILSHSEKTSWKCLSKYGIGQVKKKY